jgi:hypothetical protein
MASVVCLKVDNLRKTGYPDLEKWLEDPSNVYTGRHGRIFIHDGNDKKVFHYPASRWQNPFTLKNYDLKKSLQLYVIHLFQTGIIYDIDELRGKTLGCFCEQQKNANGDPLCHAQVLADLLSRCYTLIGKLKNDQELPSNIPMNKIQLIPSVYKGRNTVGDFGWMIQQPEYSDALFVFNDNEEAFVQQSRVKGAGNAVIRPYQHSIPPRSTGIPTGRYIPGKINAGYTSLNDGKAKTMIDWGMQRIHTLLATGKYRRVYYSSDGTGGLGTGIFNVGNDVKRYIIAELTRVVTPR